MSVSPASAQRSRTAPTKVGVRLGHELASGRQQPLGVAYEDAVEHERVGVLHEQSASGSWSRTSRWRLGRSASGM